MELLDRDDIPMEDIKRNMQELDSINKWLGGHRITIAGLKLLLGDKKTMQHHILEIGCGGGDNLRVIKNIVKRTTSLQYIQALISIRIALHLPVPGVKIPE